MAGTIVIWGATTTIRLCAILTMGVGVMDTTPGEVPGRIAMAITMDT